MEKTRRILAFIVSLVICVGNVNVLVNAEETESTETIEYIIKYNSQELLSNAGGGPGSGGSGNLTVEQVIENNLSYAENIQIIDEIEDNDESNNTQLLSISTSDRDLTDEELNAINGVYYAEPNYRIHTLDLDPGFIQQWAINGSSIYGINIDKAWEMTTGNSNVTVAILDTGIDINHRDLSNSIYTNANEAMNGRDTDGNGYKDDVHGWDFTTFQNSNNNGDSNVFDNAETDKHGTHVAGIIAAGINNYDGKGVAPSVKLLPVKILSDNDGTVFNAIKGIEYAEMMGAKIANCSWGSEHYSQFLYDAIENSDMLFVCAAGNDGSDVEKYPTYPAAYEADNIISVGATDVNGNIASFSNYGKGVDIAAPGKGIYSTLPNNGFGSLDGTSMAAPYVAGAGALLLSVSDNLTAQELRDRILQTPTYVSSLKNKVNTSGILNVSDLLLTSVLPTNFNGRKYGAETILVGNEIYSIGGYNGSNYLDAIERFDPVNEVWQTVADLPVPVADCALGTVSNKIYIIGGTNGSPVNNVQIYDIVNDTWSTGAAMPKKLYGMAYVEIDNNELYIFGGIGISGYQNKVYKYDLLNNTWATKEDMPYKAAYAEAVATGGAVYIIGGCNENGVLNEIYLYDNINDSYDYITRMSVNRKDFSAVAADNKIYIFGGSNSFNSQGANKLLEYNNAIGTYIESVTDTVEVFDPVTRLCSVKDSLPESVMGNSAVNYFGNVYLLGGWDSVYKNTVTRYFGASIPKNIILKTNGNNLKIKWNTIAEATGYKIEIDGTVYNVNTNSYQAAVNADVEHKIRVKAVKGAQESLWSDYIYHYLNSTMLDAKTISVNSTNTDKLYETGQTRWYKLNNSEAGKISVLLSNIPQGCNYLVQLINTSGEVIATGTGSNGSQSITDVVLSPYPYYIKVSSVYGGNENSSYTLSCTFTATAASTVPDRVRSAFLKPSSLDDLSAGDIEMKDILEYEGEGTPPSEITDEEWTETEPEIIDGGCGIQTYVEEDIEENENEENISLMSLNNYSEETGTLNNQGNTTTGSITLPRNSSSSQRYKLVVEVIPENEYDEMKIEWQGSNTNYDNFWWLYAVKDYKYVYYLTAIFGKTSGGTYQYKITYDYKAYSSNGNYTVRKYIIADGTYNEDYNNTICGNETPQYAIDTTPSTNSNITKTGKIDHPYDRDYYYVTATSNEKVTAYLTSPTGKKYDVEIYDNRCTTNTQSTSEYMDGWVDDGTSYATIKGQTSSSVRYCIRVGSYDGSFSYDDTYTLVVYKYNMSRLGNLELNNSFNDADLNQNILNNTYIGSTSKMAQTISFSIDSPVDVDKYAVNLNAGEKISVKMDLPSNYNDESEKYRIEIYSNVVIGDKVTTYKSRSYNNPDTSRSKYVTFIPESSGKYYVAVRSLSGQYDYSKYGTLIITKTPLSNLDIYENKGNECSNDFIATTIFSFLGAEFGVKGTTPIQTSVSANLDNELDVDWYEVKNGGESKTATLTIAGGSTTNNATGIVVLDSNYSLLTSGVNGNTYTFSPNETYYIAVYVNDNKYSSIMSSNAYNLNVSLGELRSDLVFHPLDWGTFIYDNSPEYLTDDDLADYNLGNKLLITGENLTGVIDVQSSHSARKYMLDEGNISFDMLLYNPTNETITVDLLQYGSQAPYETDDHSTNATSSQWVALRAWADYFQINLLRGSDEHHGVLQCYDDFEEENNWLKYKTYYCQNQINKLSSKGHYVIEPGHAVWVLEDSRLTLTNKRWSPMNITARFKTDGVVNISIAAFRNVNNVWSPESPQLIYDKDTQRSYPSGLTDQDKEGDLDGKSKGIANSVAEVEAKTTWIIDDNTTYFTPTVYNMANPYGYTIAKNMHTNFWVTNFNTNQDRGNFNNGVESDILPLEFTDNQRTWYFDTRHYTPMYGNGIISGTPPIPNAIITGNYGVTVRYFVDISNTTSENKMITYRLGTQSHALVRYKLDSQASWQAVVKCNTPYDTNDDTNDIFSVSIPQNSKDTLVFEVMLPNADNGGFRNLLIAE